MFTRTPLAHAFLFGLVGILASAGISLAQTQQAIQFDGSNDYVTFGTAPSLGASTFTLEVRFKKTGAGLTTSTGSGGVTAVPLVTKGRAELDASNVDCNYFLGITAAGLLVADYEEGAGQTSPGLNHPVTGTTVIQNNVWYHAAAVFDGTTWRLYLDGNLDATLVVGGSRLPRSDSIQHAGLATAMTSTGAPAGSFQGILDEARIWNVARTQLEIQNGLGIEMLEGAGLLGRWGLNEGSLTSAGNSVPVGVTGTLTNGPLWVIPDSPLPLAAATGLRFGGTNGYVTFGNPVSLGLSTFTVECWFRRDGKGTGASTGGIVGVPLVTKGRGQADGSNVDMNYFLGIDTTAVKLVADFEDAASGANHPVLGSTVIANGVWYHAAVTFDGSTLKLYLNGALEGTVSTSATPRFDSIQHAALGSALTSTGAAAGFLNGALDEARIWSVARTQAEIVAAMNSAITGAQAGLVARWGLNEDALRTVSSSAGTMIDGTITGSNWGWAAGSPFNAPAPSIPADPTGFSAIAESTFQINLSWTDNANNETSYEVERSTTGALGTYSLLIALPANSTSYSNTGLTGSTEYCYRVRAVNGVGPSGYSGTACATTLTPIPPADPSALAAVAVTYGQIHLTWTDNATDETGFELERSIGSGGSFTLLAPLAANTVAYDDLNRDAGAEYCYRVRAINSMGQSGYAGPVCVTTPSPTPGSLDVAGSTYVTFGDPAALDLAAFTVECWFRRDGTGTTTSTGSSGIPAAIPLITHGAPEADGSTVDMNYFLGIKSPENVLCADFEEGASGASPGLNHPVVGATAIANGTWHHAAATYNGSTWVLYLDGNPEATLAVGQPVRSNSIQRAALATALTSTGGTNGFLDGALDEARVWNAARTQAEIQATANDELTLPQAGLVARWSLDEGLGTIVNATAGTAVSGTVTGPNYSWGGPAPFDLSFTIPADPLGLTANAVTHTQVTLAWTDNSTNETGFEIERSTLGIGGPYTLLTTVVANSESYDNVQLSPSNEYCYRVRAVNGNGASGYTGPECATTLAPFNTGLDLAGNTYAGFGSPAALQLSAFTIEMWLRRDGAGTGTNTGTGGIPDAIPLVAKGRADAEDPVKDINYLFGIQASTGVLCADFEEGTSGTSPSLNHPLLGVTSIPLGTWHHAAATYDGISWKLYLDGVLEGSLDVGQPPASASTMAASLGSALTSAGVAAGFFDGAMDEVRIWNVARSQSEIQAAANSQIMVSTPGLVARWSLDEGSGSTVGSSAGTSANGSISGTGYAWVAGAPFDLAFNHQPLEPVLVAPSDNGVGVSTSPSLQVTASDPDGGMVTVTYYGRAEAASPGPDFTLIGLPDTQYYTGELNGGTAAILQSQVDWIVNNRGSRNIVYMGQLGDCVEHGDNSGNNVEWVRADAALSALENSLTTGLPEGVPFGISVGNHDQSPIGNPDGTTTFYNQFFGTARFAGRQYYGGHYGSNNDNWYELFSASGMDFVVVSFEYDPTPDPAVLAWANGLLTTYSDRRAIVVSHFLCNTGNPGGFGPQGQTVYDALKGHSNLFLMLCGHVPGEGRRQDTFNGNTVYTLLSDYQGRTNGGNGWLRILEFSPANNAIRVKTYSPWLDQFEADADSSSQFTIPYNMVTNPDFVVIGTATVPSGSTASVTWPGLIAGTSYEWYATVDDGATSTVGPLWRFTTAALPTYTLDATVEPVGGGSITKAPDQASYLQGASVDLTAVPALGYHFVDWTGDLTGSTNPETVIMDGNKAVVAHFALNTYTITATAGTGGTITPSGAVPVLHGGDQAFTIDPDPGYHVLEVLVDAAPQGPLAGYTFTGVTGNHSIDASFGINTYTLDATVDPVGGGSVTKAPDQASYDHGTSVDLTAVPTVGYHFVDWTGDLTGSTNPETVLMDGNKAVVAHFAINTYTLDATADPLGGGSVTKVPDQAIYDHGTSVDLTAVPTVGYHFVDWTGDLTASTNPETVVMDGNKAVVAHFALNTYTITATAGSGGTITPSGAVPVVHGADQGFTIDPDPGYHVAEVLVDGSPQGPLAGYTFTGVTGNHSIDASFAINTYTLDATVDPVGSGSVTKVPDQTSYDHGTSVDLTAVPATGYHFVDWTGNLTGSTNPDTLVMDGNKAVVAHFALNVYTITATAGSGGTITPAGAVPVMHGADQGFTIDPDPGYHVVDVLVDGSPQGPLAGYTFTGVTGNHTIDASFAINTYTLDATADPVGGGSVTKDPDLGFYDSGSSVQLSAVPSAGYQFVGWTGDLTGSANPDSLVMDGNKAVVAHFALNVYTITATAGAGGTITPSGAVPVVHGADQGFTISPDAGYHVVEVLVDGSPQGPLAGYTFIGVTGNHGIDASFAINTYTLDATVEPVGSGSVTKVPDQTSYDHGTDVQLTAVPSPGYSFLGWSGDASGTENPLLIAMDADKTVTAAFAQLSLQPALALDGVDDYLTFGAAAPLGAQQFTLEVRFKRTGAGVTASTGTGGVVAVPLLAKGRGEADGSNLDMNYFLGIDGATGKLAADFEDLAASNNNHPVIGSTVIQNGVWYQAAATFDGAALSLYLNGNFEGSVATSAVPRYDSVQHAALGSALTSTGAAAGFFLGELDEARIWNVARSESEIQADMDAEVLTAPGVIGRWGLNEGTGQSAGNSIPGSPAGTLTNGPIWVTDSPLPLAPATGLRFSGTNGYVNFGDPVALDLPQFTVECWFRRDGAGVTTTTGSGGVTDAIPMVTHGASESDNSPVDMNFFLGIRNSDGVLCADFEEGAAGASPGQNHPVVGVTSIPLGAWHHAVATYDGATWNLYLDGSLERTLSVGQPVRFDTVQPAALATSLTSTGTTKGFFDGALDEVRVWSVARNQAQIISGMNSEISGPAANLVARWGVNEDRGATVMSSAGTTIDGAVTGTGWSWTAGAPYDATPPTAPADPTGLIAAAASHVEIDLNWVDVAGNETGYEIERSISGAGGPFAPLITVPANSAAYADLGLTPSSEYCYRVRAVNAIGVSGYTGPACATTQAVSRAALDVAGNTYIGFGDASPLRLSQFTLEMWIRRDGAGVGTNTGTGGIPDAIPLFAKGRAESENAAVDVNYLFGIRASDGVLCADFEEGATGSAPSLNHPVAGSTPITLGTWHHVAATYDGTTWNLYLDGNLDATLTVGQPVAAACSVGVSLASALTSGGVAAGFFDGVMDEVRIWNVAHTLGEIQARVNAEIDTPQAGLVARWSLNEATGAAVNGSAGTSINGSITGSAYSWIVPGAPFDLDFNRSPAMPVLVAPGNAATGASTSPNLQVQASDPDGGDVTVTFYGRPAGSAGADFTLIGLPDTQYYSGELNGGTNAIFQSQTNWIVANRAGRNIVYAAQLGDCVEHGDNGGNDIEWQRADLSLGILENPLTTGLLQGIPFGVAVGNHDQSPNGDAAGATTYYNQYFGVNRFAGRAYYGGHYGSNNDNWYDLFSASGMDFIVISFEYDTTPDAPILAWADALLTTYSVRRAIVVSHNICGTGNPAAFSVQGQAIYNALKGHSNLFLMLCGHVSTEGRREDTFNGNNVYTLLSDYQSRANGGNGWLRIMEFSPANNVIRVKTYSPWLNQFEADADSSSQFTLAYPMSSATPFSILGSVTVPSGSTVSFPWPNLSAFTGYEWYATVSDTALTATGPVWTFTTGADDTPPAVLAAFPRGAETLTIGMQVPFQWIASDNTAVASVDLLLSRNGVGGSYEAIATGIANSGMHDWTVAGPVTSDAFFKVVAHDPLGNVGEDVSDQAFSIAGGVIGVEEDAIRVLALSPVSPNPANRGASFSFSLPKATRIRLSVIDVQGREVGVLAEGTYPSGVHAVAWDRRSRYGRLQGGVYFIRLQASGRDLVRKVVLTD